MAIVFGGAADGQTAYFNSRGGSSPCSSPSGVRKVVSPLEAPAGEMKSHPGASASGQRHLRCGAFVGLERDDSCAPTQTRQAALGVQHRARVRGGKRCSRPKRRLHGFRRDWRGKRDCFVASGYDSDWSASERVPSRSAPDPRPQPATSSPIASPQRPTSDRTRFLFCRCESQQHVSWSAILEPDVPRSHKQHPVPTATPRNPWSAFSLDSVYRLELSRGVVLPRAACVVCVERTNHPVQADGKHHTGRWR